MLGNIQDNIERIYIHIYIKILSNSESHNLGLDVGIRKGKAFL